MCWKTHGYFFIWFRPPTILNPEGLKNANSNIFILRDCVVITFLSFRASEAQLWACPVLDTGESGNFAKFRMPVFTGMTVWIALSAITKQSPPPGWRLNWPRAQYRYYCWIIIKINQSDVLRIKTSRPRQGGFSFSTQKVPFPEHHQSGCQPDWSE